MRKFSLKIIFLTIVNHVNSLNPGSYGTGAQGADARAGYKAAYARAREMREQQIAQKVAQGDQGVTEAILQQTYQERYTINVEPRSQSCFFIEDLQVGYGLSVHYTVLSTKNGNPLDISFQLKDSNHKMLFFQVRKKEDFVSNHTVNTAGDYEMCFNNRYSVMESKKIMWEIDIIGDEERIDTNKDDIQLAVNQTIEEYEEQAKMMRVGIVKVRTKVSKARSQQWWLSSKTPKDTERLISINQMIDFWSIAYSIMVVIVGVLQTVVVRRLFNIKPPSTNMKMRT